MAKKTTLITVFVASAALFGCNMSLNWSDNDRPDATTAKLPPEQTPPLLTSDALKLTAAPSCESLKTRFLDRMVDVLIENLSTIANCPNCIATPREATGAPGGGGGGLAGSNDAPFATTKTNNQEEGVDEPDIVKTDSKGYIFILRQNQLLIEKGYPADALEQVGMVALTAANYQQEMLIDETSAHAIIVGRKYNYVAMQPYSALKAGLAPSVLPVMQTQLTFIDVSDKSQPTIVKEMLFDGNYQTSRLIGDRLHIVTNLAFPNFSGLAASANVQNILATYLQQPQIADPDQLIALRDALLADLHTAFASVDMHSLLPILTTKSATETRSKLVECNAIYYPQNAPTLPQLLTVTSMNIDGSNLASSATIGAGYIEYASDKNLYLANTSYNFAGASMSTTQETIIHKFAISGAAPQYKATGSVAGVLHNQFSLDEFGDTLRLVTTSSSTTDGIFSSNHLYTLRESDSGTLDVIGSVPDFGAGESIFSARFLDNKAFVVTFRQTDPLFAFDLSDAANPQLMGEIEIPGFSTYMHPLDDNHLLTIGNSGTVAGANSVIQFQIFDVSDLSAPKRTHVYEPANSGYSWSSASYDHHAFNYFSEQKLLAVPYVFYSDDRRDHFNGMLLLKTDVDAGISEIGRVDHQDLLVASICSNGDIPRDFAGFCASGNRLYFPWSGPTRSAFMLGNENTYFYSISDVGVKIVSITDPSTTLGSVLIPSNTFPAAPLAAATLTSFALAQ